MPLELDTRQRAMLQEMGVPVWLPEPAALVPEAPARPMPAQRPQPPRQAAPVVAPSDKAVSTHAAAPQGPGAVPEASSLGDWDALHAAVQHCRACKQCSGRLHATLVPPASAQPCDWMVVGDPPDAEEDQAGAPFAGADGVLLDNMLRALDASAAYRSNVLKCRTNHGAVPQATELAQCSAYLQREIALVRPKVILAMGRFAHQVLLSETPEAAGLPLGRLRGQVYRYQGVAVVLTYAPKQLMRNSADKAKAWADLCLAAATREAAGQAAPG